ncbi:probable membrane metalloprotease ARASP2, chloroplastic [Chenopodium quinoa]|uniref:probable membrane metalloprotease ARASP2, chloroplastic n=1 Tax=Chenopodium quinoa TaxID=63459 RepID=UPI000B786FAC|nr:probable membrane metalloprotease ARASP2, chloroplastic [Chenopodium quinoa]XP_021728818.1 probable membrane metalloprotease ARASP2, chloroplastic [Chenopodium quinoa]
MVITLSSSPPIPSFCGIKTLFSSNPKSLSKPRTRLAFLKPKQDKGLNLRRIHNNNTNFGRESRNYRCNLSGFDLGGLEGPQSVIEAAGVLTAIIVVHESGHFLAAYLQGIHVSKFAVGFGPILAKFNANNVEYSLRAFPLGGFVGFPDNDPDSDIPVDDVNLLKNRPIFDRVLVVSAGVIANILFAFIIIFVQIVSVGLPVQEAFPGVLVPDVRPFSAASRDGLLPGDVILSVNGFELSKTGPKTVTEVVDVIKTSPKKYVLLGIHRGGAEQGQDLDIKVTPDESYDGTGKIGVQLSPNVSIRKVKPSNIVQAFNFTGKEFWGLTSNVLDSLKQTFMNFSQSAEKVSGPVAIIAVGAEVARSNIDGLYQFAAILNINLAVINLLPLPALDGGTLALILIEAARGGKKLPLEVEQQIMSSGITLVLLLGVYLIIRDTLNLDFFKEML